MEVNDLDPNKPFEPLSGGFLAKIAIGTVLGAVLLGACLVVGGMLVDSFWAPYAARGEVIEFDMKHFLAAGGAIGCVGFVGILVVFWIAYFRRWTPAKMAKYQKKCFAGVGVGLVAMAAAHFVVVPMLESQVQSWGYQRCAELEFDGLFKERVYVREARLCRIER